MTTRLDFNRLVHSDWSIAPKKRWTAIAVRSQGGWLIDSLEQTPAPEEFLECLFDQGRKTLAGFDFPIGLPTFYLNRMKVEFCELLSAPTSDRSQRFFTVAETMSDICSAQPFYRKHPAGGRHVDLVKGLGCDTFNDLLRECDKKTRNRSRAESIFWTVGPKQVGKAALSGWQEVLIPALERQARLWPFGGPLSSLDSNVLAIAETYPAEAYQHIGMARTIRKRSQQGRRAAGYIMLEWASRHQVQFKPAIEQFVRRGFGAGKDGEDPFDAIAGLCGMIEVSDGRRAEAPVSMTFSKCSEGWILGQIDVPSA
ncbi:MAG: hypothetical protein WBF73_31625 [Bradyrhizobium sp.]|jgi:hypothetical protein